MEDIIEKIDRALIKSELTKERFLRSTRKGENEIYSINANNSPNILREIGRLREVTFRASGGGTGKAIDLDEFDEGPLCYDQLIVWSPEDEEIIGGYRYILCNKAIKQEEIALSTAHYFDFTERFVKDYLPTTIELGRSWVQPEYQPSVNPRKGLYSLDNIWDGLGAITRNNPSIEYFFGKVTMYTTYNSEARNFLLHFLHHYFPDNERLMHPFHPLQLNYDKTAYDRMLDGLEFNEGFKVLNSYVREHGEFIPPLINIYMNLSPTMKTFGTAINPEFGDVEETGILVTLSDIYEEKKERYLNY